VEVLQHLRELRDDLCGVHGTELPDRSGRWKPGPDGARHRQRCAVRPGKAQCSEGVPEVGSPGRRSVLWLLEARGGRRRVRSPIPERRAMRGLLVSDLHYALRQFDWVQAAARRFDLVVVAGDSLDISSYV